MKNGFYIFLIIIAAFIVRAIGIQYGLPFLYHDDEPIIVNYALAYGTGDFNPHVFNIAPLITYILFFIYGIFFAVGYLLNHFHSLKDFAYLYLNNPTPFYIIGRVIFGLICGTLSVYLLYVLGKKYFNRQIGILASVFLAFNFLHVRDSHFIYFDIPLTLCVISFFIKGYDFFSPVKRKDYALLGLLLGLSISVKYQGIYLIFPFLAFLSYNLYISRDVKIADKSLNLFLSQAVAIAVIFAGNPFLFLNFSEFMAKAQKFPYMAVSPLHHLKISLFNGCGALMTVFGILGMIWAAFRNHKSIIISSYIIFYYILIVRISQLGERLVLPIIPLLLLFAAYAVFGLIGGIKDRVLSASLIILVSLILIYPSLGRIFYSDLLFLREDTRTTAYNWIKDNIRAKSRIALDATASGFPRLERDKEQVRGLDKYFKSTSFGKPSNADQTKLEFMLSNPYYAKHTYYLFYIRDITKRGFLSIYPCIKTEFSELKSTNAEYVVLSNILVQKEYRDFVKDVENNAVPIKVFSPYKESTARVVPIEAASVPSTAFAERELRDRKCYGPYIKIYRLK